MPRYKILLEQGFTRKERAEKLLVEYTNCSLQQVVEEAKSLFSSIHYSEAPLSGYGQYCILGINLQGFSACVTIFELKG